VPSCEEQAAHNDEIVRLFGIGAGSAYVPIWVGFYSVVIA
jgi:hypothetical protein